MTNPPIHTSFGRVKNSTINGCTTSISTVGIIKNAAVARAHNTPKAYAAAFLQVVNNVICFSDAVLPLAVLCVIKSATLRTRFRIAELMYAQHTYNVPMVERAKIKAAVITVAIAPTTVAISAHDVITKKKMILRRHDIVFPRWPVGFGVTLEASLAFKHRQNNILIM
ncbi:hypothetical protein CRT38_03822 [Anaplasma phagocytophilum str. CRT38]|uniref:Uncharacterized protein n=1 Tax=Anaplasma phagocytophilum str. CRT38 TaxID=1269275 RepID=S6GAN3_ANAPH|nr:hypothetical protein CRT38_03822 [Anaplasma phagocytophilum str. CRT38]KDB57335.1 hypothetical protein P030_05450 [Anaplasma phagocytophilum str. CRT35]